MKYTFSIILFFGQLLEEFVRSIHVRLLLLFHLSSFNVIVVSENQYIYIVHYCAIEILDISTAIPADYITGRYASGIWFPKSCFIRSSFTFCGCQSIESLFESGVCQESAHFLVVLFLRSSLDCWYLVSFAIQLFSVHYFLERMPLIISK